MKCFCYLSPWTLIYEQFFRNSINLYNKYFLKKSTKTCSRHFLWHNFRMTHKFLFLLTCSTSRVKSSFSFLRKALKNRYLRMWKELTTFPCINIEQLKEHMCKYESSFFVFLRNSVHFQCRSRIRLSRALEFLLRGRQVGVNSSWFLEYFRDRVMWLSTYEMPMRRV